MYKNVIHNFSNSDSADKVYEIPSSQNVEDRYYLPSGSNGQLVHHDYYSLSYIEEYEQAEWVAYELTKSSIQVPNVPRSSRYNPDYEVKTRSAFHRDYSNSGFTRGHLAPAGDMAFNEKAMEQSFFMSNMSPQKRKFNNGIWRELEEQTRDWAYKNKKLYIVTGPVLIGIDDYIGENRVAVPKRFYKVLLDLNGNERKGIGFVMSNEMSNDPLQEFAVSIDSVENLTGLNFFNGLMDEDLEIELESRLNLKKWKFSNDRFRQRVDKWNFQ
jgi:endonuclease G